MAYRLALVDFCKEILDHALLHSRIHLDRHLLQMPNELSHALQVGACTKAVLPIDNDHATLLVIDSIDNVGSRDGPRPTLDGTLDLCGPDLLGASLQRPPK